MIEFMTKRLRRKSNIFLIRGKKTSKAEREAGFKREMDEHLLKFFQKSYI